MPYYAQKPPKQHGSSHDRPGVDPDGFCSGLGCEILSFLTCCSFISPCWIAVLLPAAIVLLAGCVGK